MPSFLNILLPNSPVYNDNLQSSAVQSAVHLLIVHMYSGQLYRRHAAPAVSAECCDSGLADSIGLEY